MLTKEAVVLDGEAIKAYTEKGFYFRKQGDLAQAVQYFTKVVELVPLSAKAQFNRGHTLDEAGLLEPAIYDYTQAIAIEPDFAMAYASRGIAHYVLGKFSKEDETVLLSALQRAVNCCDDFTKLSFVDLMTKYNTQE
ncbi:MAG: tetratricopeptide repeat protein [Erysipelotrichaceae bacterium]|nr:tetratricopeptide repeat protein [Erysipelotrichaceae bacterium]